MSLPTLTSLSPASALVGSTAFTLTVNGQNFDNSAAVLWGGVALATTFVSSTQVTAAVTAPLLAAIGAALITVTTTAGVSAAPLSFLITSPYDLCSVLAIKSWLSSLGTPSTSVTDDAQIQACISAAGVEWIWRTQRANADGSLPASSPLIAPVAFTEYYDGNGRDRLFLRQQPVRSVQSLFINGVAISASSGYGSAGYAIHQDGKSLILRCGGNGASYTSTSFGHGWNFAKGLQNVQAAYTAGFAATPPDITLRSIQMVAQNYKRRGWIDQQMQQMAEGAGTIRYRDWELPPEVLSTMRAYSRTALA